MKLKNLDGTAIHIAHNSVGNRIDLVFNIGELIGEVESLSKSIDECVIKINGDIYEQGEDMWNFGFAIYLTCDVNFFDFALAESKKKSSKKFIKESWDSKNKIFFDAMVKKYHFTKDEKNRYKDKIYISVIGVLFDRVKTTSPHSDSWYNNMNDLWDCIQTAKENGFDVDYEKSKYDKILMTPNYH